MPIFPDRARGDSEEKIVMNVTLGAIQDGLYNMHDYR
jgi:hypothetical protein